jgi:Tfp pilus assembly protein PilF
MGILKNNEAVEDIFKGKLASAHDLIDMAMKMDPAHKNILNNKGVIYILQKDFQSGSKIFERILRDKTSLSAGGLYNMAFACTYGLDKREEARKLVDQLLEIDPELYEAYLLSGDLAYHVGDMKRARDHWTRYAEHGLLPGLARRRLFEIEFIPNI